MRIPFLDLARVNGGLESAFFRECRLLYRKNAFIGGPAVEKFEKDFARRMGSDHCVGVSSGTSALHLALIAAGVKAGDEVILPAFTFPGTAWGVLYLGAKPVFADVRLLDGCVDPEDVARKVGPRTKALIAVHLFGHPASLGLLKKIAGREIALVEDAAQAHGGTYRGKALGSIGDFGCFSFYPTKNLGGIGDGGAILTNENSAAEHLRRLRDHGQSERFFPEEVGFNARLDAIQAQFLALKLPRLKSENTRRAEIAGAYLSALEGNRGIIPLRPTSHVDSAWHAFVVRAKNRVKMIEGLNRAEIAHQVYYPAILPRLKPFRKFAKGRYPAAEELARTALALPLHPGLNGRETDKIKAFLQGAPSPRGM